MATLAPSSAKRIAIACPIPEVPPVTSPFLPWWPGKVSLAGALSVVAICVVSSLAVRALVPGGVGALQARGVAGSSGERVLGGVRLVARRDVGGVRVAV